MTNQITINDVVEWAESIQSAGKASGDELSISQAILKAIADLRAAPLLSDGFVRIDVSASRPAWNGEYYCSKYLSLKDVETSNVNEPVRAAEQAWREVQQMMERSSDDQ